MFDRPHHQRIAKVLSALDGPLLAEHQCWFGGGTAMALRFGEYRQSVDIDFMVSTLADYRWLRERLTGVEGIAAIVRPGASVEMAREVRGDQYGVRTVLISDGEPIKFEVVREDRIKFETPTASDDICGVLALTPLDMATSKLLANTDRWADDAVYSRDLIDLAMMMPKPALLRSALSKARAAYGDSIVRDVAKAVAHLYTRPGRVERCLKAMDMTITKGELRQRINRVAAVVQKPDTTA